MKRHVCLQGNIQNVLYSRIGPKTLKEVDTSARKFSFGLGSLRSNPDGSLAGFGEMITVPGLGAVVPAINPELPEFSEKTGSRLKTPFRCVLPGIDGELVKRIQAGQGISALDLWLKLDERERQESQQAGPLLASVLFVRFKSLRGAYVRREPLLENAPQNSTPIIDPKIKDEWFGVEPDGGGEGAWGIIVGVGLRTDLADRLKGKETGIFYRHPDAPPELSPLMVHQHVLIIDNVERPQEGKTAGELSDFWLTAGTPRDVRHVLENSVVTEAWGAYWSVGEIEDVGC